MTIKTLFNEASSKKASDLHLLVGVPPVLRIDGTLVNVEGAKVLTPKDIEQMVFSILSDEQKNTFLEKKDFDFSYSLNDNTRYRVNIHYEKSNIGLVARVINDKIPNLDEIQMPEVVSSLLNLEHTEPLIFAFH